MHALSKAVLLAILAVQASAATLSHGVRSPHHHAAIAHHAARAPESADGVSPVSNSLRRRQKVCRKRTSSLVPASTSSSSSSTKEPEPTTTKQPEPTTTKKPDPTTTKAPTTTYQPTTTKEATTTKASSGGYYGGTNTGQGTFYNTGLVACGQTYTDDSYTAAVSIPLFDNFPGATGNPNNNPLCGKWLYAWRKGDPSRNVKVQVVDRCEGCAPANVDFTPTAFNHLGDPSEGRIDIQWTWA